MVIDVRPLPLKQLNLKTESYPFDWVVSKLDTIKDCIETKFVHFLNVDNYITQQTETVNQIDDVKVYIGNEEIQVNTYYEKGPNHTYNYQLALTHHNLKNDIDYFQRCIQRFYELLESDVQKCYLYFHPIMGIRDFEEQKESLLNQFDEFHKYITTKTTNLSGIYFILVKHQDMKSVILNPNVVVLYCNDAFVDAGGLFMGNHQREYEEVIRILTFL